ncbi:MAG: VWA domain-containing protein [Terracidiphilus sp.]
MRGIELHIRQGIRKSVSKRDRHHESGQWACCRNGIRPIIVGILGVFAVANVLASQELKPKKNTAQDSGIVLRQTVRRVRVDVVVTDAQGHTVTGLQASGFHVAEDGKPQSIRQFEYHADENAEATLPKRPALPPHTFMNVPEAPEHGPLMVLLYDALNTPVTDQLNARAQMLEFLKKSAGRRIAIFYLGDRLRFLQGFTSDADLLASAVNRTGSTSLKGYQAELTGNPASQTFAPNPSERQLPAVGRFEAREENARQAFASELLDDRVDVTLDALVQIGRFLSDLPGRKNLIWYSGSFPAGITLDPGKAMEFRLKPGSLVRDDSDRNYIERMKKAINLLNAAEVSIYPIDARGLLTDYPFERKSAEFATMNLIGEQTGGRAFYNTNGLKEALETAGDEGSSYYSLLYAPTNMKFDGSVRRISVRLGHGHYDLAYRRSYFASDLDTGVIRQAAADEGKAPAESTAAASQFGAPLSHQLVFAAQVDAVGAPAPATAEQMAALAPYQEQAAKAEHRRFVPPAKPVSMQQYEIQYGVLAKQLDLPISANSVYHSDVSIAALAFDEDGATLWGTETRLKDVIPSSKIGDFRKNSFHAIQTIFVPVDTAVIRLVVHDEHSGRIGSMEVRLPLPRDQQHGAGAH